MLKSRLSKAVISDISQIFSFYRYVDEFPTVTKIQIA
jgi:hypothetical protein